MYDSYFVNFFLKTCSSEFDIIIEQMLPYTFLIAKKIWCSANKFYSIPTILCYVNYSVSRGDLFFTKCKKENHQVVYNFHSYELCYPGIMRCFGINPLVDLFFFQSCSGK